MRILCLANPMKETRRQESGDSCGHLLGIFRRYTRRAAYADKETKSREEGGGQLRHAHVFAPAKMKHTELEGAARCYHLPILDWLPGDLPVRDCSHHPPSYSA